MRSTKGKHFKLLYRPIIYYSVPFLSGACDYYSETHAPKIGSQDVPEQKFIKNVIKSETN